jgi:predicted permease
MPLLRTIADGLRSLFRMEQVDRELEEELSAYVEMASDEKMKQGMSRQEAARQVRLERGSVDRAKETVRAAGWESFVETCWQDVRFGARMLRKNPGFTLVAVLTLALGIGANAALFSVVNGVLLNPLPYPHPEELVSLAQNLPPFSQLAISYPDFVDWTRMNRTFQALAAYRRDDFNLTGSVQAQRVTATHVSASFFPLLGARPVIGRNFSPDEDQHGAAPVVMLSAAFWRSKFNGSPAVLGKTLPLDGVGYTVIGVVPQDFYFCCETTNFRLGELYVPIGSWNTPWMQDRGAHPGIYAVGRLNAGATLEQARADMERVANNLAATYPDSDKNTGVTLMPLKEQMVGNTRPILLVLLAAVGFVLLIACANVANLLLARSTGRAQEFAIRAALGATRGRVTRQLLIESMLLALVGGMLGLLIAGWGTQGGLAALPEALPRAGNIQVDAHVLIFTLLISVVAALLFGLAPILGISAATVETKMKENGRGSSGTRLIAQRTFVTVEIALAVVLLVAAGLTIRSLANLWSVNPGFDARNVLTFTVALPASAAKGTPDQVRAYLDELTGRIAATPGVTAVSRTAGAFPVSGGNEVGFWIEGQPHPSTTSEMPNATNYMVGPEYLRAMDIPLLRGRFLTPQDNIHSRFVIVVDEEFRRQYFPTRNPIGEHIHLAGLDQPFEIVGVVGHVNQYGLDENKASPSTQLYTAVSQIPDEFVSALAKSTGFVVRTQATNHAIAEGIRHSVGLMSDQQVAYDFESVKELISRSLAARRFTMTLLAVFATVAVLLASIGIYGVMSYVVGQRTREIGIRMALGAAQQSVLLMVLSQAGKMLALGVAVGLLASLGLSRVIASMLFRVSSYDPLTFAGVAMILSAVGLMACYIPARRAARVDPMVALRYE